MLVALHKYGLEDILDLEIYLVVPGGDAVDGGVFLQQPHGLGEEAEEVRRHIQVLLKNWRERKSYTFVPEPVNLDPPMAYWALGKSWKVAAKLAL